jgi:hypothetical protein
VTKERRRNEREPQIPELASELLSCLSYKLIFLHSRDTVSATIGLSNAPLICGDHDDKIYSV